jgi:hypothetical protein
MKRYIEIITHPVTCIIFLTTSFSLLLVLNNHFKIQPNLFILLVASLAGVYGAVCLIFILCFKNEQSDTEFTELDNLYSELGHNYNYEICYTDQNISARITPISVYDDGTNTYIRFPSEVSVADMPLIFIKKGDKQEQVRYNIFASQYATVNKIFSQAVLVAKTDNEKISQILAKIINHNLRRQCCEKIS